VVEHVQHHALVHDAAIAVDERPKRIAKQDPPDRSDDLADISLGENWRCRPDSSHERRHHHRVIAAVASLSKEQSTESNRPLQVVAVRSFEAGYSDTE
jgi:hypothetical protein